MASNETASTKSGLRPARRTIVKGAAWAVPAIAVASPALAQSASQCNAISFGTGSFKCSGQSSSFIKGYGLRFCVNSDCLPGAIDGQTVTIRLDLPVTTSSSTLQPLFDYSNPTIVVNAGDTQVCTSILYVFSSNSSANWITFSYQVEGGPVQELTVAAPPDCTLQVVPDLVGKTVAEATAILNATGLQLGDVTFDGTDPGTGLITSQTVAAGTSVVPMTPVGVTVNGVEPETTGDVETTTSTETTDGVEPAPGADTESSTASPQG